MSARWIIAGGGTGGHLYPGLAVAEVLLQRQPDAEVLFVGTDRGIESRVVPAQGYRLATIKVEGIMGRGVKALWKASGQVPLSILESRRILKDFKPTAVLGVGGYASGPLVLAARMLGIPTAVQEQNAQPGFTNKVLGRMVRVVFTSWPDTVGFAPSRMELVGNPIRASIVPRVAPGKFTLLVFGGSQGSRAINRAMAEAAPHLSELRQRLRIVHQQGRDTAVDVAGAYAKAGLDAEVRVYIDDMPAVYAASSMAVCRAGATSLAELAAARLPALLIPFPHAADNHQEKNADVFVRAGAAEKLIEKDLSGEALALRIRHYLENATALETMSAAMQTLARPDAAERLVTRLLGEES